MSITIKNSKISNSGIGIKAIGKVNMDIEGVEFKGNGKDMDFYVHEASKITIENIASLDCKTESITYEEFSSGVEDSIALLERNKDKFTEEQLNQIRCIINELGNSKGNSSKIRMCLSQILEVGKSTASGMLVAYLQMRFGWH